MFVLIASCLLNERHLVNTAFLKFQQVFAKIVGGSYAASAARECLGYIHFGHIPPRFLHFLKLLPEVSSARFVFAKRIQATQRKAEEFKTIQTALNRRFTIVMARKAGDHANIRIYRMADWDALIRL